VADVWHGALHAMTSAETTGRICYGVELNPAYVDVAIERWQALTSEDAVLVETGERFADLMEKTLGA
jgi:DNA modification methylase